MTKSIFEDIAGMGARRIKKLWQEFESIENIQDVKIEEIKRKTGFPEKLCKAIQTRSIERKN